MTCFLGLDLGTTNVKALAFSPDSGRVVAQASAAVDTLYPQPGWCEQDVLAIWAACREVLGTVMSELAPTGLTPRALGLGSAMHSLLGIDEAGQPLTHAIIWSDNRSEAQVTELRAGAPALPRALYERTGIPVHPMTPFSKLLWMRSHQPELLRTARWLSIKEFIWYQLTGRYEIDYSMATATGLFDSDMLRWSGTALDATGLRREQLSEPVPTTHRLAFAPRPETEAIGLPLALPLVIGASDGCLANLGAGAIEPGITTLTIGTSGAIRQTSRQPLRDPQARLFSYILDTDEAAPYFIVGGPTNNGANVLEWVGEKLSQLEAEAVLAEAESVPAGSEGLLFLPYLQGERAPIWDAHARGAYLSVAWSHTRAHFARAALEGVLLNLRHINQLLAPHTGPTRIIHANGGFARSDFWVQMLADVFGVPVRLNDSNESGSIGAILLAMKATGFVRSLAEATRYVGYGRTFEPDPDRHATYQEAYRRFSAALDAQTHAL